MARSMPLVRLCKWFILLSSPAFAQNYTAENYSLELDGVKTGFIRSFDGGNISADVISRGIRPDSFVSKHIGRPKYEDISLQIGLGMSKAIHDWIESSWNKNYIRKSGSIITADYDFNVKREREFLNALLTETTIPACDGSSKDVGYITMKLKPTFIRDEQGSGKAQPPSKTQRPWLSSNFKLELEGLDTSRVTKVDSFTVKYKAPGFLGQRAAREGQVEFPNLKVTLSEKTADSWRAWHEDFIIRGNNDDDKEKSGALVFVGTDLREEILRIELNQCGIFRLTETRNEDGILLPGYVTAELYCERLKFAP